MKLPKTKIETFDYVWNPVWGCENDCFYCYAKSIANRFAAKIAQREIDYVKKCYSGHSLLPLMDKDKFIAELKDFKPTILNSAWDVEFPTKPAHIFVGSMSDIEYWSAIEIQLIMQMIEQQKQHRFYFLTKNPISYRPFPDGVWVRDIPTNVWKGITVSNGIEFKQKMADLKYYNIAIDYVSIEPLLGEFDDEALALLRDVEWVIVGAMTGPLSKKNQSNLCWVYQIVDFCKSNLIDVFVKNNFKVDWAYNNPKYKQIPQLVVGEPSGSF